MVQLGWEPASLWQSASRLCRPPPRSRLEKRVCSESLGTGGLRSDAPHCGTAVRVSSSHSTPADHTHTVSFYTFSHWVMQLITVAAVLFTFQFVFSYISGTALKCLLRVVQLLDVLPSKIIQTSWSAEDIFLKGQSFVFQPNTCKMNDIPIDSQMCLLVLVILTCKHTKLKCWTVKITCWTSAR